MKEFKINFKKNTHIKIASLVKGRGTACGGGIAMQFKHNKNIVPFARKLRKNMTKEERHSERSLREKMVFHINLIIIFVAIL